MTKIELTLPDRFSKDADYKSHEDVVEWSFWNDVYKQAQQLIDDLRFVLGKN